MGFPGIPDPHVNGGDTQTAPRAGKGRSRIEATKERGCAVCPLHAHWPNLHSPRMPIEGYRDADVLVIGEAPGQVEDEEGRPFVGPAGNKLRPQLPMRRGERIAFTNIIRCRPPGNRNPTTAELRACSLHLETDIAAGKYKAILGLGSVPLSQFIPGGSIMALHGLKFPVEIAGKVLWYYPTLHPSYLLHTSGPRGGREESPAEPIFQNDIRHFFRELDTWPTPRIERPRPDDVILAHSEEEARSLCYGKLRHDKPLGLDIETSDLRPQAQSAEIMTAAVSDGELTVAWSVYHPDDRTMWGLGLLLDIAEEFRWVAHSAGFELAWLLDNARRINRLWEPQRGYDCSMAAARLYQRRHTALNLGILTRLYLGTDIKELSQIDVTRIRDTRLTDVLQYNGLDAYGCYHIFDRLGPLVAGDNYQSLIDTVDSVTAMQLTGLDTDQDAAHALHEEWHERARAAEAHAQTVYEVRQYCKDHLVEFRLGSDHDLGEVLTKYSRLPLPKNRDGSYKTTDDVLTELAPDNPLVKDALEFRHARKMVSTYIQPVIDAPAKYVDRRLHPVYSTTLTRTLRTSAEDPSIQNYPKRVNLELRQPIVPPPGCLWASADFGQLEARVYACASRDRELVKSTIAKEDIHSFWLNQILNQYPPYVERLKHKVAYDGTEKDLLKKARDVVKGDFTFASFYGSTARNVAERANLPESVAYDVLADFWDRYSGAANWLKHQRQQYRETGVTSNLCGVERYSIMQGNEPVNNPIQSSAARLVLECQNELYRMSKEYHDEHFLARINIHDDLTFALPDDTDVMRAYIEIISQILVKVRFRWQIVPLMVEWKVGTNWGELYPVYEHVGDFFRGA